MTRDSFLLRAEQVHLRQLHAAQPKRGHLDVAKHTTALTLPGLQILAVGARALHRQLAAQSAALEPLRLAREGDGPPDGLQLLPRLVPQVPLLLVDSRFCVCVTGEQAVHHRLSQEIPHLDLHVHVVHLQGELPSVRLFLVRVVDLSHDEAAVEFEPSPFGIERLVDHRGPAYFLAVPLEHHERVALSEHVRLLQIPAPVDAELHLEAPGNELLFLLHFRFALSVLASQAGRLPHSQQLALLPLFELIGLQGVEFF
mmetsp:Transcript_20780/g.38834  ORF Transcript_20780/g.38834 Transcript_20780/m.38834 type:complete len:256 (+) Transcript_20780:629-1396(+)